MHLPSLPRGVRGRDGPARDIVMKNALATIVRMSIRGNDERDGSFRHLPLAQARGRQSGPRWSRDDNHDAGLQVERTRC
jgi:hypothetical protein